jgi:hypothetical protein
MTVEEADNRLDKIQKELEEWQRNIKKQLTLLWAISLATAAAIGLDLPI